MKNFPSSFLTGFLSTSLLFAISLILALGIQYLRLTIKGFCEKNNPSQTIESKKSSSPYKRKKRRASSQKRSIEIDPSQIDKIYVKKSS